MFETSVYKLKIFAGVDSAVVDMIIAECPTQHFKKWEVIMEQGDAPDGKWYIIKSGQVQVFLNAEEVANLKKGEIFWEMALLNEEKRSASIKVSENLKTIVLSQQHIFTMIENDENQINKEIMRRMEENLER